MLLLVSGIEEIYLNLFDIIGLMKRVLAAAAIGLSAIAAAWLYEPPSVDFEEDPIGRVAGDDDPVSKVKTGPKRSLIVPLKGNLEPLPSVRVATGNPHLTIRVTDQCDKAWTCENVREQLLKYANTRSILLLAYRQFATHLRDLDIKCNLKFADEILPCATNGMDLSIMFDLYKEHFKGKEGKLARSYGSTRTRKLVELLREMPKSERKVQISDFCHDYDFTTTDDTDYRAFRGDLCRVLLGHFTEESVDVLRLKQTNPLAKVIIRYHKFGLCFNTDGTNLWQRFYGLDISGTRSGEETSLLSEFIGDAKGLITEACSTMPAPSAAAIAIQNMRLLNNYVEPGIVNALMNHEYTCQNP